MNMKSFRRYLRLSFDKGVVLAVGFGCLYLYKQQYIPDVLGPLSYGIITVGAIGYTRCIIQDVDTTIENEEYQILLQILNEQKSEILANRNKLEDLREACESFLADTEVLEGWRRDPSLVPKKITILKKLLKIRDDEIPLKASHGKPQDPVSDVPEEQSSFSHDITWKSSPKSGILSKKKVKVVPGKIDQKIILLCRIMKSIRSFLCQVFDKGAVLAAGLCCLYLNRQKYISNVSDSVSYGIITAGAIGFSRYILQDADTITDKNQSSVSQTRSDRGLDNDVESSREMVPSNLLQVPEGAIPECVQEAITATVRREMAKIQGETAEVVRGETAEFVRGKTAEFVRGKTAANMQREIVEEERAENVVQVVSQDVLEDIFETVCEESHIILDEISENIQREISEKMEAAVSERMKLYENVKEEISDKSFEEIIEKISREVLEEAQGGIVGKFQGIVPEKGQEKVTEKIQEEVSREVRAEASDKVQQDVIKNVQEQTAKKHEVISEKVQDEKVTEKRPKQGESLMMPEDKSGNLGEKFPEGFQKESKTLEGMHEKQEQEVATGEHKVTGEKEEILQKEASEAVEAEFENAGKN